MADLTFGNIPLSTKIPPEHAVICKPDNTGATTRKVLTDIEVGSIAQAVVDSTPSDQVNSDWSATSGVEEILNKPDLSQFATNDQLAEYATVDQLSNYATTEQLGGYATDQELSEATSGLVTQAELEEALDTATNLTYVNKVPRVADELVVTTTTTNGIATFDLTDNTGTAFSNVFVESAIVQVEDAENPYAYGAVQISADKKTATVLIKRRQFVGVTVLSVNVLGSQSMALAPNGTKARLRIKAL